MSRRSTAPDPSSETRRRLVKLAAAVTLILAIEQHPQHSPTETVKLDAKTRQQLLDALRGA